MGINAYVTGQNLSKWGAVLKWALIVCAVGCLIMGIVAKNVILVIPAVIMAVMGFIVAEVADALAVITYDIECIKVATCEDKD